jgi:hypothetical protein
VWARAYIGPAADLRSVRQTREKLPVAAIICRPLGFGLLVPDGVVARQYDKP